MSGKTKAPSRAPATPPAKPLPPTAQKPPADARWQRTVRYGWDKGDSKGGRR